jgi:hypothetical protein
VNLVLTEVAEPVRGGPEWEVGFRLPKITAAAELIKDGNKKYFYIDIELEEKEMDQFNDCIGDGKARISVGADMGEKDYGNGYGIMFNVALTCDQSEDGLDQAVALAVDTLGSFIPDIKERVKDMYDEAF